MDTFASGCVAVSGPVKTSLSCASGSMRARNYTKSVQRDQIGAGKHQDEGEAAGVVVGMIG